MSAGGQGELFFPDHLAEIDQRVAHPSKGSIDADIRLLGYLLKTESAVMPEQDHLALVVRQFIDQGADLRPDLVMDDQLFDVVVGKFPAVEKIHLGIVVGNRIHLLFFSEVVYDQVMGDPDDP